MSAKPANDSQTFDFNVMDDSASDSDLLKDGTHQKIANRLFDLITKSDTKGLTIGLEGSWGSGKSTVVNLLRKKLEETNEAFVFYIDSWVHEGDYLRRAFLEGFTEQLQEKGVDRKKLEIIKNEITNKVVVKHNDTSPKTKTIGTILSLLTIFLLPIGFLFIDNSCGTLTFGKNLSPNWLFIVGLLFVLTPLVVAFIAWFCNRQKGLTSVFWTTETTETTTTETTEEPEKTSIEFEKFFRKLLEIANEKGKKNIVCVIDNLDRINPSDALKIWSTLQVFVQSKNPNGRNDDLSRVWVIVPYDESGLRLLWDKDEQGDNKPLCSKSFFDKSFQLRIEVPKMLFEGWENYADKIIHDSLENSFSEDQMSSVLEMLKRGRVSISDAPSPREIKTYVNQVGFLYPLHKENASLDSLCFYVDLKYLKSKSADEIKKGLLDRSILSENKVLGFVKEKTDIEKELCAILFNVNGEKGMELLIEDPVLNALNERNEEKLQKLVLDHEHAVKIFVQNILAENKYDCKNYMHLLKKTFEKKIEDDLLHFVRKNSERICTQMGEIASDDDLCAIFQVVMDSSEIDTLRQLSQNYVAMQHERLKGDVDVSAMKKIVESFERVYSIVDNSDLIYIDYSQLGMEHFQQIADAVGIERLSKFGKFVRGIDTLDEDYSKKIVPNSPELSALPLLVVRLGCSAGCLRWDKTLQAVNNLVVYKPNYNLNTEAFVQSVKLILELQDYDLKDDSGIIKTLLNKPAFWHYVSVSQKEDVKQNASYLLAKYCDDLNLPQMQHVGQSSNGVNSVGALFKEKNDNTVNYFCERINASKKSDFIWSLAKNHAYQLIGGIIEKQLDNEEHWFFNTDKPFECFANAIEYEYSDNESVKVRLLTEFEESAQLISCVQKDEAPVTTHLSACKLLLESDYSRAVVEKVKHELAVKTKDVWSSALNGNTELLDIVQRCKELEGQPLEELSNNFADAFKEYVKSAMSAENADCLTTEELANLYDCMNDSFKKYVSGDVNDELLVLKFAVLPQARDFFIAKLDYDVLIKKYQDVNKIIKDLVDGAMWNQLGFVVALIDKLGDQLIIEKHYTKVMQQPLKSLKDKANKEQFKIVESLCKFFNVNLDLMEDAVDADDGKAS